MPWRDAARPRDPLWQCMKMLDIEPVRLIRAVTWGVFALGSALSLAGLSAWLITRAWQMPPVLDLSVAVVAVRALGISRAICRYGERLASHDVALRGAAAIRVNVYARLSANESAAWKLRRGNVIDHLGSDIDTTADVVVRSVVPMAVAAILSGMAIVAIAIISISAAIVLAGAFLASGVLAPWLAAKAAYRREILGSKARSQHAEAITAILDHAPELRVGGHLETLLTQARQRRHTWIQAHDAATAPTALASAVPTLATGIAVLGALSAAAVLSGAVSAPTLAVLVLLPLAAFESIAALPAAAIGLTKARVAANRLNDLLGTDTGFTKPHKSFQETTQATGGLQTDELRWHTGTRTSGPLTIVLQPGEHWAVVGASGVGKTSLLMTLAGLVAPVSGTVAPTGELGCITGFFAEDAHLFATTVRDNLLAARGDATDENLLAALQQVGLGGWIADLPSGLDTVLTSGAASVSGGQRRRLLLARAVLSPATVLLLDEPTEHLDAADTEHLLRELLDPDSTLLAGRTIVVATHHLSPTTRCPRIQLGDTVSI